MSLELIKTNEITAELMHEYRLKNCPTATDAELKLFALECKKTRLDPITRQICLVGRYNRSAGRLVHTTQITIDGARLIAERSNEYEGQTKHLWTKDGKEWLEVWLDKEPPKAAMVGVYRKGFREALHAVATWEEYKATYTKNGSTHLSPMWRKMPALMLAKCAEALALRKAFPNDLSGLYTNDEMHQAENDTPISRERELRQHGENFKQNAIEVGKIDCGEASLPFGAFAGVAIKLMDEATIKSQLEKMQTWISDDSNVADERFDYVSNFIKNASEYLNKEDAA